MGLYTTAFEKQITRSRDALDRLGRGQYGPQCAMRDASEAYRDAMELAMGLASLWWSAPEPPAPPTPTSPTPSPSPPVAPPPSTPDLGAGTTRQNETPAAPTDEAITNDVLADEIEAIEADDDVDVNLDPEPEPEEPPGGEVEVEPTTRARPAVEPLRIQIHWAEGKPLTLKLVDSTDWTRGGPHRAVAGASVFGTIRYFDRVGGRKVFRTPEQSFDAETDDDGRTTVETEPAGGLLFEVTIDRVENDGKAYTVKGQTTWRGGGNASYFRQLKPA